MKKIPIIFWVLLLLSIGSPTQTLYAQEAAQPSTSPATLPKFEDYPVEKRFTGTPAKVNLISHPAAKNFKTRLTEAPASENRFAGHYRIVEIGCGTNCQSIWAVDLIDGSVHDLFTASSGVAYRPDSRLIVKNDPVFFEDMLKSKSAFEVEAYIEIYGPPEFYIEQDGKFERIKPKSVSVDPIGKKLIPN